MTPVRFSLPHGHRTGVDAVSDSSDYTGSNHLHVLRCAGLENGAYNHDDAAPHDTPFTPKSLRRKEGEKRTDEAADVIHRREDTFEVRTWVVKLPPERWQADHAAQHALVIAE